MADTLKVLGQAAPAATTETDLYTVPAGKSATCSSLMIANRAGSATTFRVSVSVGGGATANKDYIYYDIALPANETIAAVLGLTLAATDKVRVYAASANVSFNLFGVEVS